MRRDRFIPVLAFVVATRAFALGPGGPPPGPPPPPFQKDLFPPDLVLSNQMAIGLSAEQIQSIKRLLTESQSTIIDKQTDLQRAAEILGHAVQAHPVEESSALAAADQVMTLETAVKKAHLSLLIRIKNVLTGAQVAKLMEIRSKDEGDRPWGGAGDR